MKVEPKALGDGCTWECEGREHGKTMMMFMHLLISTGGFDRTAGDHLMKGTRDKKNRSFKLRLAPASCAVSLL